MLLESIICKVANRGAEEHGPFGSNYYTPRREKISFSAARNRPSGAGVVSCTSSLAFEVCHKHAVLLQSA